MLPFTPIYGVITWLRNKFFDWGILKSIQFEIPVICLGNLNVGGTGKTPHTKYLVELLKQQNEIATLSRGYGRKTTGYQVAGSTPQTEIIGDEPTEIKTRFPNIIVAVDEKRVHGIERLLQSYPNLDAIILDDSFQHRYVKPAFSILLTSYSDLFFNDIHLPGGNLREFKSGKQRANCIIITKCPDTLSEYEMKRIQNKLKLSKNQNVFFSKFQYNHPIKESGATTILPKQCLLISGIANPKPLAEFLISQQIVFSHLSFKDHHNFNLTDVKKIRSECAKLGTNNILTTEKDYMRLRNWTEELNDFNLIQLPISVQFLKDEELFKQQVLSML